MSFTEYVAENSPRLTSPTVHHVEIMLLPVGLAAARPVAIAARESLNAKIHVAGDRLEMASKDQLVSNGFAK